LKFDLRDGLAALETIVRRETGQARKAECDLGGKAESDTGELLIWAAGYSRLNSALGGILYVIVGRA
jgi:hypothetical protein